MIKKEQTLEVGITKYMELSEFYFKSEFSDIQLLLEHLAYSCSYNTKFPILGLLKAVSSCLLMNQLESIFFAYVIETNGWRVHDSIIQKYKKDVKDIGFYTTPQQEYKMLTLYLLLCGYTAKFYLNECTQIYLNQLEKVCPDFKTVFSQWVKQEAHTTLKINPKSLNKVYKYIYLQNKGKKPYSSMNYSSLVDNILNICPAYNPQRGSQKQIQQPKPQKVISKPSKPLTTNISTTIINLPILSSSGFLQQIGILPFSSGNIMVQSRDINTTSKRQSFLLNSSDYGIGNNNNFSYSQDQADIVKDLRFGFDECQSDNQDNAPKSVDSKQQRSTYRNMTSQSFQ